MAQTHTIDRRLVRANGNEAFRHLSNVPTRPGVTATDRTGSGRSTKAPTTARATVAQRRISATRGQSARGATSVAVTERAGTDLASFTATRIVKPASAAETLLRRRDALPEQHPDRNAIRVRVIEDNLSMAHRLARRYAGRGEAFDDLAQAAALALIKSVDGYDATRDVPFVGYAIPTILGSLKRHFRDTGWALRVARSAQELGLKIGEATDQLNQQLGRTPTTVELADLLQVTNAEVVAATAARHAYRPTSLDTFHTGTDDGLDLASRLGAPDPAYARIDNALTLQPLLATLPARTQRILTLRFTDELTQSQIAAEIGVSQMHVSRILTQALQLLRTGLSG